MKIFSRIMLALIFVFLVAMCVLEDWLATSALQTLQDDCTRIEALSLDLENLSDMQLSLAVDTLEYNWTNNESNLCYLVNHKSIQEVGMEIAKLKVYQAENDVKEFRASLEAVKFYSHSYRHFMGANLHNVI